MKVRKITISMEISSERKHYISQKRLNKETLTNRWMPRLLLEQLQLIPQNSSGLQEESLHHKQ